MSETKKKIRKISEENRHFQDIWMYKYFFIQFNEKPTCLICRESVAVYKEFNIQRHYETKHKSKYESIKDKARESKLELLKKKFADETSAVKSMFSRQVKGKDDIVTASYKIANLIAKDQQALNSGEFIKKCIIAAIEEIAPEKCSAFKEISLSRPTITRRIEDIGKNLQDQLQTKAEQFSFFSLALDESTDNRDTAQLLIFVRGIDREFTITEELASLQSMKDRTSADDLFEEVLQCITKLNLNWKNLCGLTTDGAPSMIGSKNGLVTKILHQMATQNLEQPLPVHCIIHQQALCCKVLEMDHVMNVVRDIVNFIRSRGLNHRQFQAFLEEVGSEFSDVLYHNQIRWLSRAQVLSRFFNLLAEIEIFMTEKGKIFVQLSDSLWLWDLAFLTDISSHCNDLNLKLQTQVKFVDLLEKLKTDFHTRFKKLKEQSMLFRLIENPFQMDEAVVQENFQMEIIELKTNNLQKDLYEENRKNLPNFYKNLDDENFPELKKLAQRVFSMFGSTYLCEQTFSRMKCIKSKERSRLTDDHLHYLLRAATTKFEPDIKKLALQKQPQVSH
ncbi:general transcription factor II-I repeat domain-containing protein 2-like [Daktulosphaira vitifoliae]|uniref:general transcription factor II-I repeat domain-containing protein 2-like n=1 Tax=Daktulosphaira vitifoliae TaxID=58002 RepID=UPI0021AAB422|nr:general transcription factor II-I repeat domain-containing protein 2-like [Daktulosphaira vitifoliae]